MTALGHKQPLKLNHSSVCFRPEADAETESHYNQLVKNAVQNPPVLILGCGRSGTSIFGEMFQQLGSYEYQSEPEFSDMLAKFGLNRAAKVPRESVGYPPDAGLSFPLNTLLMRHPTTKIFWIVRHPLDTICSLRVGIGHDWGHHPRPPDWSDWVSRPILERCAHHWLYINSHGFDSMPKSVCLVRFEDMIQSPANFAENVCANIGVDAQDYHETLSNWVRRVRDTNDDQFVEALTSRDYSMPDHKVRVDRWRENLSSADVKIASRIVSDAAKKFGYSLVDDRASP